MGRWSDRGREGGHDERANAAAVSGVARKPRIDGGHMAGPPRAMGQPARPDSELPGLV